MKVKFTIILVALLAIAMDIMAQIPPQLSEDSLVNYVVPEKYLDVVGDKAEKLERKLNKKADKALSNLQKQESRIQSKLTKIDSLKAKEIIGNAQEQYSRLEKKLQDTKLRQYIPSLDSIETSLNFLQQNPQFLSTAKDVQQKLKDAQDKVNGLKGELQKAEDIKRFLKERRQYLKDQLSHLGLDKELKKLNKEVYYYSAQIKEYKEILKDQNKIERKALELLSKTKVFKDFMQKNSMLASLFRLPGDPNDPSALASLAGLQTRAQVNALIQNQVASGGPNAAQQLQQGIQQAQNQLNQLKDKLNRFGGSSGDLEMPEGFKPNNQKTKSFLQRLELGTNIQSQRSNGFFPVTSDIGLSLGYKLNDKSVIGFGASYKVGWGKDIQHINITHQGIGLRSFIDWKIKGTFWMTGGYESNYRREFKTMDELKYLNAWQQSGLVGLSKVLSMKTKFFRKTKVQLLFDLLSYQQVPKTQPLIFRIGYNF